MRLTLRDNLLFTTVTVAYQGITMDIQHVLLTRVRPPRCERPTALLV
jgi:hypothetical protein